MPSSSLLTCCIRRIRGLQELEKIGVGGEHEGGLFADGFAVCLHGLDGFVKFGGFGVLAVDTVVDAGGFVLAFGAGLQGKGDLLAWLFPPIWRMASCR